MMVAAVVLVCAIFSIVMMVAAMISGFGGIFAVMMAMDVAAIFIVRMTGFMAVVVAGASAVEAVSVHRYSRSLRSSCSYP